MQAKTLIILNPHAGNGSAGRLWTRIEPLLWKALGKLVIAVTQTPEEVAPHLARAREAGLTRVICIGGDGTSHSLINELIHLNQSDPAAPHMTFGCLPIGTGRDWSRTLGTPHTPEAAVRWIASAHPVPVDVGHVDTGNQAAYFLNIASAGASGEVTRRADQQNRRPWTYLVGTLLTLARYTPPQVRVLLDGKLWYEGKSYLVAVANGRYFGHNMRIAPDADIHDGLFDVVLVEGMPRLRVMGALQTAYTGEHIKRGDVHTARARSVEIQSAVTLPCEKDGEVLSGGTVRFECIPHALEMLAVR